MKISEAKEILTNHINGTPWLKERNLDSVELQKFKSELDNSDDTDMSVEQISRFFEVLSNKELFEIFLAVKDYFKAENILTSDNLLEAANYIEREFRHVENNEKEAESNEEKAVKEFKDAIAQFRKRLHDNNIFSEENEAAVLQNFKHCNSIVTALKILNTAEILNSKNRATVVTLYQNSEYTAAAISEILEQLNVAGIFKCNPERNQANFDTVCQIAQNAEFYCIAPILSVLHKAGMLDQTSFDMVCQNAQYAKNISFAFMNDMSEKTENILNLETLTAIYQNPKDAANIVRALKTLKSKNILNQEIQTDVCQNPQYAAAIAEHAFSPILEQLNIAKLLNPEILTALCQYPQHAENIVQALKTLKTENLLNSETQTAICQNPQMAANFRYSSGVKAITALKALNAAKILNKTNFDTTCQIAQHAEFYLITYITEILSVLNNAGMLDHTSFNMVCQNAQYAKNISFAFMNDTSEKTENILNLETLTALCQYPQHAENIVQALKTLKTENLLNSETQTAVCQNPQMAANFRYSSGVKAITALKALNAAKILNKTNFDTACRIAQDAESYTITSILSFLNNEKMFNQTSFDMVCQNAPYAKDIHLYLMLLKNSNILNPETQTAICQNPQYAKIIYDALQTLNIENLLNSETQTAVCQKPQSAEMVVDTLKILKTENFLNPKNQTAVCQNTQFLHVINAALKALINAKKLTQPLVDNIFSNPKDALFIAEKNGGKPAGNKVAKDFSKVRTAGQILAQAWRGKNTPFTSKSIEIENSPIEIGDFPQEILEKIAAAVTSETNPEDALDTATAEYVVMKTFQNFS